MKSKWLISGIVLLSIASCKQDPKAHLQALKEDYTRIGNEIKTLEAEIGVTDSSNTTLLTFLEINESTFNHYIELQGKLDGDENVSVMSKVPGTIAAVLVKVGQNVSKGQVLAELDHAAMSQNLAGMNDQLKFVTDVYNKQKGLWDKNIGSEVQYLQAKNNKDNLENQIKSLKEQIDMYRIVSPINGSVEAVPVKVGQTINPGFEAFRVINLNKAKVLAEVSEAYAAKVKEGNKVSITFPDQNLTVDAKIDFTSRFINPVNRTFTIESHLDQGQVEYRANMIAILNILDYSNSKAIVIPINLIQNDSKGQFVWIGEKSDKGYTAKKRSIVQGKAYNGTVEVLSGLAVGDKVLTSGLFDITENQMINL